MDQLEAYFPTTSLVLSYEDHDQHYAHAPTRFCSATAPTAFARRAYSGYSADLAGLSEEQAEVSSSAVIYLVHY